MPLRESPQGARERMFGAKPFDAREPFGDQRPSRFLFTSSDEQGTENNFGARPFVPRCPRTHAEHGQRLSEKRLGCLGLPLIEKSLTESNQGAGRRGMAVGQSPAQDRDSPPIVALGGREVPSLTCRSAQGGETLADDWMVVAMRSFPHFEGFLQVALACLHPPLGQQSQA